ncbi:MAG: hypothetical protein ABFD69_04705 [Candidatus Sumerlaeia bacterium]
MNRTTKAYLITSCCMVCLSMVLAYVYQWGAISLFFVGPPLVIAGILDQCSGGYLASVPVFVYLSPIMVLYYGLLCLPILMIRKMPGIAIIWLCVTLPFHLLFLLVSRGLARM